MKRPSYFYLIVCLNILSSLPLKADDRLAFAEKIDMGRSIAGNDPRVTLNSITSFLFLDKIVRCKNLVLAHNSSINIQLYDAILIEYPTFISISIIRNKLDIPPFDKANPEFAGTCDFGTLKSEEYVRFGDQTSPLYSEYEDSLLK